VKRSLNKILKSEILTDIKKIKLVFLLGDQIK